MTILLHRIWYDIVLVHNSPAVRNDYVESAERERRGEGGHDPTMLAMIYRWGTACCIYTSRLNDEEPNTKTSPPNGILSTLFRHIPACKFVVPRARRAVRVDADLVGQELQGALAVIGRQGRQSATKRVA